MSLIHGALRKDAHNSRGAHDALHACALNVFRFTKQKATSNLALLRAVT